MSHRLKPEPLPILAVMALALRLLTPAGYMPASPDSGLLFELCPDGLPVEIGRALAGGGHHHHGHGLETGADGAAHQCPVGHMLLAALAVDTGSALEPGLDAPVYAVSQLATQFSRHTPAYRSRAPPA